MRVLDPAVEIKHRQVVDLRAKHFCIGFKVSLRSGWVGYHYSPFNRRLCVNVLPFVTIWFVRKGGIIP